MQHGTFVKKPISVEAVLWDGSIEALMKIEEMIGDGPQADFTKSGDEHGQCIIPTLEGDMKANVGDWIIRGVRGECYPCKPDIFQATYEKVSSIGVSFGKAIALLKSGKRVARLGWNGKGMFLFLRKGRMITGVDPASPMGGDFESLPHICMRTADGKCCVGWLASQTDMLAEDWFEV